ncbi:MAG: tRNA-binding protein [Sphingobacteriales bacterium]|jgi:tRNA-binding protein|nr:tRNA-binding protein [Sphingobacteriales bacterium]MBP9140748.1 tRNA-binding protein [Chitinophagales bacterium]MDA0197867.1 tRNA-binding protein [Bacteroidota bacterium]MBK6889715.1 tRNA-binding protein [Sphingobacteriales bacterium]MBK7527770.1 tRNA-binding protein [Sphingobacteriales bacterium]
MEKILFSDFEKIDIRVGVVEAAELLENARKPAYKLVINFGEEIGVKRSSAQITHYYQPTQLIGRQVIAVVNFNAKQVGKFISEVLVLGLPDAQGHIVLLAPEHPVPLGARMF